VSEAVLKARSPSCGCHHVYDGTFSGTTLPGEGITARALRDAGVSVRSEEDLADELSASRWPPTGRRYPERPSGA